MLNPAETLPRRTGGVLVPVATVVPLSEGRTLSVDQLVGHGGVGEVYGGTLRNSDGRQALVAAKLLRATLAGDPVDPTTSQTEAENLKLVRGPHALPLVLYET